MMMMMMRQNRTNIIKFPFLKIKKLTHLNCARQAEDRVPNRSKISRLEHFEVKSHKNQKLQILTHTHTHAHTHTRTHTRTHAYTHTHTRIHTHTHSRTLSFWPMGSLSTSALVKDFVFPAQNCSDPMHARMSPSCK